MPDPNPCPPRMSDGEIRALFEGVRIEIRSGFEITQRDLTEIRKQTTITNGRVSKHDDEIEALKDTELARAAAARRTAAIVGVLVGIVSAVASGLIMFILTGGLA